jgi:hypothetical protein
MKAYGGVDVFLTSALVGGEWSVSRPGPFNPGERAPANHWIGGGPQSHSGRRGEENILDPPGTPAPAPSVVQPVAIRYTDYAIQAAY